MNFKYSANISIFFFTFKEEDFELHFMFKRKKQISNLSTSTRNGQTLVMNKYWKIIISFIVSEMAIQKINQHVNRRIPQKTCHEVNIRATYDNSPRLDGSGAPYFRSVFQYLTFRNLVGVPSQCILFLYTNIPRLARVLRSHFSIDHWYLSCTSGYNFIIAFKWWVTQTELPV